MRIKEAAQAIIGSTAIYVVMAACGGSSKSTDNGPGIFDPTSDSGTLDAMVDPVATANAEVYKSGSRLKARYYAGEDGSKQFIGWHDSQRNEDCAFMLAEDGKARCMPSTMGAPYYADSACSTTPLFVGSGQCPQTGTVSITNNTLGCASTWITRSFAISGGYSGTFYLKTSTGCTSMGAAPANAVYSLGTQIPPTTFAAATAQVEP